jgi:hypothetical protein
LPEAQPPPWAQAGAEALGAATDAEKDDMIFAVFLDPHFPQT